MKKSKLTLVALLAVTFSVSAEEMPMMDHSAMNHGDMEHMTPENEAMNKATPMTNGEVVKLEAERVTLKHEALPHLNMPAMTMTFVVADPAQLGALKVGDKVEFKAMMSGKMMVVQQIHLKK